MLEDNILDILELSLNAASLRQKIYSENIANIDTPGYKKYRVVFEEVLKEAIEDNQDLSKISPIVVRNNVTSFRNDGNNVDLDEEMTLMNQNALKYQSLVEFTRWFFNQFYTVAGGKRG
ncbi:MAG: flagellar basal body rod protein FlgB [bacterium]